MPLSLFLWLILFCWISEENDTAKRFLPLFLGVALVNYLAHWFYFTTITRLYSVARQRMGVYFPSGLSVVYYYISSVDRGFEAYWNW